MNKPWSLKPREKFLERYGHHHFQPHLPHSPPRYLHRKAPIFTPQLNSCKAQSQLISSACKQSRYPYYHVAYGETEAQRNKLASQIT